MNSYILPIFSILNRVSVTYLTHSPRRLTSIISYFTNLYWQMIIVEHGKLQVIVSVKLHISFNRNNLQAQVSTD